MRVKAVRTALSVGTSLLMLAAVSPIRAQSLWLDQGHRGSVEFEVFKPFLNGDDISALSTAYFFSARFPITEKALFVTEVPFVYASFKTGPPAGEFTESGAGNPYLGIEVRGGDPQVVGHFGVRLPLMDEYHNRLLVGANSDYTARYEAFSENVVPLTLAISHQTRFDQGVFLRYFGGINAWVLLGEGMADQRVEGIGLYSLQLGYVWERTTVSAGLGGRVILTEEGMDLRERTAHEAGFNAEFGRGILRPTAFLRVPLGEGHGVFLDYSVGIGLRAPLGSRR